MSRLRIGHGPDDWRPEEPGTARVHSKAFSVPAVTISEMRPVLTHARYMENRTRTKPPNPFSLHPEARHVR